MSRFHQTRAGLGRFATGGLTVVAALGLAASSAQAASITAPAKCKSPLTGTTPTTLSVSGDIPSSVVVPGTTQTVPLAVKLDFPKVDGLGQAISPPFQVNGQIKLKLAVTFPDGFVSDITVPVSLAPTIAPEHPNTGTPAFSLAGTGSLPSLAIEDVGTVKIDVVGFTPNVEVGAVEGDGLPFVLRTPTTDVDGNPFMDSDGNPSTFDIPCRLDPPAAVKFAEILGLRGAICPAIVLAPNPPGQLPLSDADITTTSVRLSWTASPYNPAGCTPKAVSYKVTYGDKSVTVPATQLETTISGLSPSTAYAFKVEAIGQFDGGFGDASFTVNVTTDSVPVVQPISYGYTLAGNATLKNLTKGTLPLKGSIDAKLTLATGAFTADLVLNQTQGRLTALGFLPVTAKIGFVPSGKTTGSLLDGVLKTNSKVRIKVQEVKLFGAIPLAGGNNCQTKSLSDINLQSTQAEFSPLDGGPIAGTFAISDLNGCGALNGLVSPLTAGGGNTINLGLTPKAAVAQ